LLFLPVDLREGSARDARRPAARTPRAVIAAVAILVGTSMIAGARTQHWLWRRFPDAERHLPKDAGAYAGLALGLWSAYRLLFG